MKKLLFLVLILLVAGCVTIPPTLKQGSTLLVKSYDGLEKDYATLKAKTDVIVSFMGNPASITPYGAIESVKAYKEAEEVFKGGLTAVGIAVRAMNDAIQALGE